jgi:hypothetical protein
VKRLILVALVSIVTLGISAQDSTSKKKLTKDEKKEERREHLKSMIKQEEEGALIYAKQNTFGAELRTNGYGVFYELGKMQTRRKTNLYSLELTEIKDSKEEKNATGLFTVGNPYVFGKINNFYQLKFGFGQQYLLGQKGNKNPVAVSVIGDAGLSVGLLRPYFLEIDDSVGTRKIRYTVEDSAVFVDKSKILGNAGIGSGWSKIKFKPGVFAKAALRFDYNKYNETISAVEIGVSAEFYSSKIPILLFVKQHQLFVQGHIAIEFGRRR